MSFLQNYELLKKSIPVPAVIQDAFTENCEMSDYMYQCKDCYSCFDCFGLERGIYCIVGWGKDLVDCQDTILSELCYECIECRECYSCTYVFGSERCRDCYFSSLLVSCADCFGCVGLTHKQYCIFNKQYTKENYLKEVEKLKTENPQIIQEKVAELKRTIPHPASTQVDTINCPYGESLSRAKDCYWCFNADDMEHCGYIFNGGSTIHCWDLHFSGGEGKTGGMEFSYEVSYTFSSYNSTHLYQTRHCSNCHYSAYLDNCSDCFGCVGLKNKKYCILNNQLSKAEYEKATTQIKKELGWKV